ncbi:hypothetical protein [Lihuaxuella thermophila]|uniref:hypothetical protein n=1 Tax=Lihuaxuella thermophila TaxID=1173111 RepID=UPI000B7F9C5B|nr:hypothetical protein [Lihuaxuella thermophila]
MGEVHLRPFPADNSNGRRQRIKCLSDSEFDPRPKGGAGAAGCCILVGLQTTETGTADRSASTFTAYFHMKRWGDSWASNG